MITDHPLFLALFFLLGFFFFPPLAFLGSQTPHSAKFFLSFANQFQQMERGRWALPSELTHSASITSAALAGTGPGNRGCGPASSDPDLHPQVVLIISGSLWVDKGLSMESQSSELVI